MDQDREQLRLALLEDNSRLETLGRRVAACVEANDPHGALAEWGAFEGALLRRLDLEEMHVLPRFAAVSPADARRLRDENVGFRTELGEIGIALELHVAKKPMFDDLAVRIRRHVDREGELINGRAARTLPKRVAEVLLRRLAFLRHARGQGPQCFAAVVVGHAPIPSSLAASTSRHAEAKQSGRCLRSHPPTLGARGGRVNRAR